MLICLLLALRFGDADRKWDYDVLGNTYLPCILPHDQMIVEHNFVYSYESDNKHGDTDAC